MRIGSRSRRGPSRCAPAPQKRSVSGSPLTAVAAHQGVAEVQHPLPHQAVQVVHAPVVGLPLRHPGSCAGVGLLYQERCGRGTVVLARVLLRLAGARRELPLRLGGQARTLRLAVGLAANQLTCTTGASGRTAEPSRSGPAHSFR